MEVARVNAGVGATVGGAAVGVGVEPHAEAIITSVISIIEIGDALIFCLLVEFQLVLCAAYWRCCARPPDQSAFIFRSNSGYLGIPKTVGRTEFAKMSLIWYTKS
jgi:hypothetical protein